MRATRAWHDAQRDFGQGKARRIACINKIAQQSHFKSARISVSVDRGNHGHWQIHQRPVHTLKQFVLQCPLFIRHTVALFQIATGTKYFFASTGQYNAASIASIGRETVPEIKHVVTHLGVDSIAHVRTADRNF